MRLTQFFAKNFPTHKNLSGIFFSKYPPTPINREESQFYIGRNLGGDEEKSKEQWVHSKFEPQKLSQLRGDTLFLSLQTISKGQRTNGRPRSIFCPRDATWINLELPRTETQVCYSSSFVALHQTAGEVEDDEEQLSLACLSMYFDGKGNRLEPLLILP